MSIIDDSRQLHVFSVRQFVPNPYPLGSFYDTLERYGELIIYRDDFPEADPSLGGSKAWCPVLMSKLVLIQQKHGWSDRETVQRAKTDLQVKACLGLGVADEGPGQATLVRHRAEMEQLDLAVKYNARFIELLKALELIELTEAVAVDTVPVTGAGQVLDTYNLLAAAVRMGLREVCSLTGETASSATKRLGLGDYYSERSAKGAAGIAWDDKVQRLEFLSRLVSDAQAVQAELQTLVHCDHDDSEGLPEENDEAPRDQPPQSEPDEDPEEGGQLGFFAGDSTSAPVPTSSVVDESAKARVGKASARIDKIIDHDVEFDEDSNVKGIIQKKAGGRIISATDPDMVHGRKSSSSLISGYKLQVIATTGSGFVLGTKLIPGNQHDGEVLPSLVAALREQDLSPVAWIGDHAYGTLANHLYFEELTNTHGMLVELVARNARPANGGRYTKDEFSINFETRTLTCPAGQVCPMTRFGTRKGTTGWTFEFAELCTDCSHRDRCIKPTARPDKGRTVFVVEKKERFIRKHLQRRQESDFKKQLAKRQVVERANAGIAQCGGKQARRFGFERVAFDCTLSTLAHNLRTLGSLAGRDEGLRAKLDAARARALARALFLFLEVLQSQRRQQQERHRTLFGAIITLYAHRAFRQRRG